MSKCVVTEPSSFEEEVQEPTWVYAMVEEYDFIVRNSAWDIVPKFGWQINGRFKMDLQGKASC